MKRDCIESNKFKGRNIVQTNLRTSSLFFSLLLDTFINRARFNICRTGEEWPVGASIPPSISSSWLCSKPSETQPSCLTLVKCPHLRLSPLLAPVVTPARLLSFLPVTHPGLGLWGLKHMYLFRNHPGKFTHFEQFMQFPDVRLTLAQMPHTHTNKRRLNCFLLGPNKAIRDWGNGLMLPCLH